MIDKFLSFGKDKLWLLKSTWFQCFAYQLSGTNEILLDMDILEKKIRHHLLTDYPTKDTKDLTKRTRTPATKKY